MVAVTQFVVCGVLSMLVALFTEEIVMDGIVAAMPAILYGGLLSVGIAYTLQVVAQRHAPATDAAILLSSEILFAALAGTLYLGERLSSIQSMVEVVILSVSLPFNWPRCSRARRPRRSEMHRPSRRFG